MAASALDTETFKGGTARVSYAALVGGGSIESFLNTENSPALTAAKKEFTEAKAGLSDGNTSTRFANLRASLGKRKEISERLGNETMGFGSASEIVIGHEDIIAKAVAAAAAKYGAPKAAAMDEAPSSQSLPAPAKGPREIN